MVSLRNQLQLKWEWFTVIQVLELARRLVLWLTAANWTSIIVVQEAEHLARQDQLRLLREHKLALIVDLDQTLVHTAISPGIEGGLPVSVQ